MSKSFTEASAYLKGAADGTGNVHEHLSQVILKLFSEGHGDALDILEHVSVLVKTGANPRDIPETKSDGPSGPAASEKAWADATLKLYPGGGEDDEEPPQPQSEIRSILSDYSALEWAGVSLGKETTYNLKLAMDNLSIKMADSEAPIAKLQFWGKILGTKKDYIILQGELESPAEPEEAPEESSVDPASLREGAEGANKYTYYVANSVEGVFTQLPDVSPEQIKASRNLKRMFTGDLDTIVGGHPPFPGAKEAGLLRAVIGLITAETHVVANGLLVAPDEENKFEVEQPEEDEYNAAVEAATAEALSTKLSAWRLLNTGLNADGRCRNVPREDDDDDEAVKPPATPEVYPLGKLTAGEWCIGRAGAHGCVRSTVYPGAIGIASGQYSLNVYIGYGLRNSSTGGSASHVYCPPFPMEIATEQSDVGAKEAEDVKEKPEEPVEEPEDDDS